MTKDPSLGMAGVLSVWVYETAPLNLLLDDMDSAWLWANVLHGNLSEAVFPCGS